MMLCRGRLAYHGERTLAVACVRAAPQRQEQQQQLSTPTPSCASGHAVMTTALFHGTRVNRQAAAAAATSRRAGSGSAGERAKEAEEDAILEEEEFSVLDASEEDEYLPLRHRLAQRADVLDQELRRLRWSLYERRQLLADTVPCSLSGRPARIDAVVQRIQQVRGATSASTATTTAAAAAHGGEGEGRAATGAAAPTTAGPPSASVTAPPTPEELAPYVNWIGTPSPTMRLWGRLSGVRTLHPANSQATSTELATLTEDLDYLRRVRALHTMNYYRRMNLIPKRNLLHTLYLTSWNAAIGVVNGCASLVFYTFRGVRDRGVVCGVPLGFAQGVLRAAQYMGYGWIVSPLVHIPRGLCNSVYGTCSFLTGRYMFDASSGRWMECTVTDSRALSHLLQREKRLIRTIGRAEFKRKKLRGEKRWGERLAAMGFNVDQLKERVLSKGGSASQGKPGSPAGASHNIPNPYEVLQVKRTATQQQIKAQYKKLAMVFHPDVAQSVSGGGGVNGKSDAQEKFESISAAYQILSNPEKRRAYDAGGAQGLSAHESKYGHLFSRTPEEMIQGLFGGEGFRRLLVGELLRSHWALRNEAQVSVSLHELEELQCIRTRQMACELAAIVDVHAKRPTIPYRGSGGAAGAAGGPGTVHRVQTSGLPDPFTAKNASRARSASAVAGRGGKGALEGDLHASIMSELGAREESPASTPALRGRGGRGKGKTATANAQSSPEATRESSPYVLHPGSNEFNCFSRDYEERCEKLVARLAEACFGPELMHEIGTAYVTGAQRFLRIKPFYAPKALVNRKVISGIGRVWHAFEDKVVEGDNKEAQVAQAVMVEYLNMEFDNVIADLHVALRYTVQTVLQDAAETEEVRRKRCYAVWYLGERMLARGAPWHNGKRDDSDLIAYVQQAATSSASTSRPPAF